MKDLQQETRRNQQQKTTAIARSRQRKGLVDSTSPTSERRRSNEVGLLYFTRTLSSNQLWGALLFVALGTGVGLILLANTSSRLLQKVEDKLTKQQASTSTSSSKPPARSSTSAAISILNGGAEKYKNITGEWVYDSNRTFAAPVCCGVDMAGLDGNNKNKAHFRSNLNQCGTTPLAREHHSGLLDFYQHIVGRACICDDFEDLYVWKSRSLLPDHADGVWDAFETCRLLGNRNVMMIGDSTMQQTASTLMNALFPAGCQTQITFYSSDTLVHKQYGAMNRGEYWTAPIERDHPDIVIVSVGAHIKKEYDFSNVINTVFEDATRLLKENPRMEIVWKTQQPAGCTAEISTELLNNPSNMYQYEEFSNRDARVISMLAERKMSFLDLRMLYSRSDAHPSSHGKLVNGKPDCLHLCSPGPLEVVAPLFQQLLLDLDVNIHASSDIGR